MCGEPDCNIHIRIIILFQVRDARLDALEADNYVENADDAGDDAYVDSDVSNGVLHTYIHTKGKGAKKGAVSRLAIN